MKIIISHNISTCCPISSNINSTRIARFFDHIINFIVFDYMIIPSEYDGTMRHIVDFIMTNRDANTAVNLYTTTS